MRKMVVVTLGLLLITSIGISPVVSAAGESELVVTPSTSTVETGETTTVDVVVESASGGVGAAEMRVAVDDPDVASISDVSIAGDPGLTDVTASDDGSWMDVKYATADTDDSGSVTVMTVTIEGEADGTTGLSILPISDRDTVVVYDEEGTGYDLSNVGDAEITVRDDDDDDDRDNDGGSADQTETPAEPTATATPAQTTEAPGTAEDDPAESTTTSTAPADDGDDSDSGEETATTSPGFGLALAVVALLAAALLVGRRD
jgi:PGF-CTERM protein